MTRPRIAAPKHRQPPRHRATVYCACGLRYRRVWRASITRGYGWGLCRKHPHPQAVLPRSA